MDCPLKKKIAGKQPFVSESFQELLTQLKKCNLALVSTQESLKLLTGLIEKRQTNENFSATEWNDFVDNLQQLRYLEYAFTKLNILFSNRLDDLSPCEDYRHWE